MSFKLKHIQIFAGNSALSHIKEHGLKADDVFAMLGASGGPKWFTLFGLDKYLISEFYKNRTSPLNLVGTSAGAFRFTCYGHSQSLEAISYLADEYSHTVYSDKPDKAEISLKARQLLENLLGEQGAVDVASNPVFKNHIIIARCLKNTLSSELNCLQMPGLLGSYVLNRLGRKHLGKHYRRVIMQAADSQLQIECPSELSSEKAKLTPDNVFKTVLASGSIPAVMEGVTDIPGVQPGIYRDGGIIDYHFDLKISSLGQTGIVLFPHFSDKPKAGWFDKSLSRTPHASSYDNVVMIAPSPEYIYNLPFGKIPDRTDFEKMDVDPRIDYWQTVLAAGDRLAEDFDALINLSPDAIVEHIKPFNF